MTRVSDMRICEPETPKVSEPVEIDGSPTYKGPLCRFRPVLEPAKSAWLSDHGAVVQRDPPISEPAELTRASDNYSDRDTAAIVSEPAERRFATCNVIGIIHASICGMTITLHFENDATNE